MFYMFRTFCLILQLLCNLVAWYIYITIFEYGIRILSSVYLSL